MSTELYYIKSWVDVGEQVIAQDIGEGGSIKNIAVISDVTGTIHVLNTQMETNDGTTVEITPSYSFSAVTDDPAPLVLRMEVFHWINNNLKGQICSIENSTFYGDRRISLKWFYGSGNNLTPKTVSITNHKFLPINDLFEMHWGRASEGKHCFFNSVISQAYVRKANPDWNWNLNKVYCV